MKNNLQRIKSLIFEVRGRQVMLDEDLANIYQVETKRLNETVKRNIDRFPPEFMFQLTKEEYESLRLQFATSNLKSQIATSSWGGRRKLPFAFTEHGVVMLSSVLNSKIATQINIAVVNAFIDMRHYALAKPDTNAQIAELRKLLMLYIEKNDKRVNDIVIALNNLIAQPSKTKTIGFNTGEIE
ncbi:MAG: ORF6N domain-containing protein [Leptospirales bacterium]|nr:ORF6N domain-containing protein [Leptospirales bacterium]